MDLKEAKAWLSGKRSCCNYIAGEDKIIGIDTNLTQQAYWIVRAYKENLITKE